MTISRLTEFAVMSYGLPQQKQDRLRLQSYAEEIYSDTGLAMVKGMLLSSPSMRFIFMKPKYLPTFLEKKKKV